MNTAVVRSACHSGESAVFPVVQFLQLTKACVWLIWKDGLDSCTGWTNNGMGGGASCQVGVCVISSEWRDVSVKKHELRCGAGDQTYRGVYDALVYTEDLYLVSLTVTLGSFHMTITFAAHWSCVEMLSVVQKYVCITRCGHSAVHTTNVCGAGATVPSL